MNNKTYITNFLVSTSKSTTTSTISTQDKTIEKTQKRIQKSYKDSPNVLIGMSNTLTNLLFIYKRL